MTQGIDSGVETALQQALRLVNLACDVQRNASDAEFLKIADNHIVPVIDENVFEMFIRPFRYNDAAETFYADSPHFPSKALISLS